MPKQWKVTYMLKLIESENQVTNYPDLGVSLLYQDNNIVGVEHTCDTPDSSDASDSNEALDAIAISQEQLKLFWELLQYKRGRPIIIHNRTAEQVATTPATTATRTALVTAHVSAPLVRRITMPNQTVFTHSDSRLIVWLRLANDARNATVDADAIRNYYMIWEDKYGRAEEGSAPDAAVQLRLIRNFVSHGGNLKDNEVLRLVEQELGVRATQYDPTDAAQQQFVHKYRQIGRDLIEADLAPLV